MEIYKKTYAYLVGIIDDALTILETGDLLQVDQVRRMWSEALLEAEERIITSQETP